MAHKKHFISHIGPSFSPPSFRDLFRRSDFLLTLLSSRARRPKQSRLFSNSVSLTRSDDSMRVNVSNHRATRDQPLRRGCGTESIVQIDTRIPAGDLSRENARHECGTLWCVRGTVVCTLNSVGTPHPHSVAVAVGRVVCHCVRLRARAPTQPRDTWACCGTRGNRLNW